MNNHSNNDYCKGNNSSYHYSHLFTCVNKPGIIISHSSIYHKDTQSSNKEYRCKEIQKFHLFSILGVKFFLGFFIEIKYKIKFTTFTHHQIRCSSHIFKFFDLFINKRYNLMSNFLKRFCTE